MVLKYLLEKEFKQFFRNTFLPKLVIALPVFLMAVVPWITNMDIKNLQIIIVDNDGSNASEQLTHAIESSHYFILNEVSQSYDEALEKLEYSYTDVILEIPADFEKNLISGLSVPIQISINAVNDTRGTLGASYLSEVCSRFSASFLKDNMPFNTLSSYSSPNIDIVVQNRYNTKMDYKLFMIPGLMVIALVVLCCFLPSLNIVGEKEHGTIEQINISPVPKSTYIFAKLIPYWVMGIVVISISMFLTYLIYGLTPVSNMGVIYLLTIIFIFALSGFGLVVSNYSKTMRQSFFLIFFFLLIFMLLSGLLTPLHSMPQWARIFSLFVPPRYYIDVMRRAYLKGGTLADFYQQFLVIIGFAIFFFTWAVLSFKKRN